MTNNNDFFDNETGIKTINALNTIEQGTSQAIQLIIQDGSKYEVQSFDILMDQINKMNDFIRSKEYTDADEKDYKKLRAKINKVKSEITKQVNLAIAHHFDELKDQAKQLKDGLALTTSLLDDNINQSIAKQKAAKKEELQNTYNNLVVYKQEFKDLNLDNFFNTKWLNKSYSIEKAKNELIARLNLYEHIAEKIQANISLDEFQKQYKLIDLVKKSSWDLLNFETKFSELYEVKEEEPEIEMVENDSNEGKQEKVIVDEPTKVEENTITLEVVVPVSKFKDLMDYFNKNNIKSKLL